MRDVNSRLPGLYRLTPDQRLERVLRAAGLDASTGRAWREGGLELATADRMVENVVGLYAFPQAVAVNVRVDGRDRLVPMVVEEPSVVAAVGNVARLAREGPGVETEAEPSVMIGQVEVPAPRDPEACLAALEAGRERLEAAIAGLLPELESLGGGLRGLEFRRLRYEEPGEPPEERVVVHVLLDCLDAMGANMVNTVAESVASEVEALTGERVGLRILSNLADRRLVRARVRIPAERLAAAGLDGAEVAERVASAYRFAWADPYRAATHNKGIMNGIDAVALATGNDWRAIEAGAHAWAARSGRYRPLSSWKVRGGALVGELELPLAVGTVGGATRVHPGARANLALLGAEGARDLARVMAAVGLLQNLAALKALATTGIQHGHMRLHARNVAATVGATPDEAPALVARLVRDRDFSLAHARQLLEELRAGGTGDGEQG